MISKNKVDYKNFLILFIICCLGFWQITFFVNIMKWDIVDINLPWRYFTSECIRNGILPLWNPYINCGFSQSADMMTWYPISWLIGLLFGNSLITLQYEYILHILIGSIGVYKLGKLLNLNREVKLVISVSFMFSGLFISNAQHFGWIVSAAWFPYVLYYYILFSKNLSLKEGIIFVLFLFLQLTGGYIGFFIITAYILVGIFIYFLLKRFKENQVKAYLIQNLLLFVIFVLLSSVALIPFYEISSALTRYHQINIDYVAQGSLPFKALISFILPFATTTNVNYWGADLSLINCYIGIIPLIYLFYSLTIRNNKRVWILFLLGLLFLSIALADLFPVIRWLYYLPLLDIFRFPVIFRFFAYFAFIIAGGIGLNHFLNNSGKEKTIRIIIYVFLGILVVAFIYNFFHIEKWKFKKLLLFDFRVFLDTASISDRIFLQAFISSLVLIAFLIILKKYQGRIRSLLMMTIVIIDMIIASQLNIYHTVVDYANPKPTQKAISELPDKFPTPDLKENIIDINKLTAPAIPNLWRNLNIFHKKTSYTGYSPYYFSSMFKSEKEGVCNSAIKNPLFYFADSINSNLIIDSLTIDTLSYNKIKILEFSPNQVELFVKTEAKQLLTFVQNYYPGWEVYINGIKQEIIVSNYTFMSAWIPKGENTILFKYKPKRTITAFYISLFMLFMIISYLIIQGFRINSKV